MTRRSFPPARCRCHALGCAHPAYWCADEPVGDRVVCLACERRSAESVAAAGRRVAEADASMPLYVVRLAGDVAPGVERIPFRFQSAAALCATLLTSGTLRDGYPLASANPDDHPFCVIALSDDTLPETKE